MASINKLSIRGVRAFEQEQEIEFTFPMTLIVGANGCGKTAILESLKYAFTGSLSTRNEHSFVHDSMAKVKLLFTNRNGQQTVVVRRMKVVSQENTFQELNGILRTADMRTGESISMPLKPTELNEQIPMLFGVNKAILEHVVFCHQEDSSWPLIEGDAQTCFGEIFGSTRYIKALEAVLETKNEYSAIVKDLKADLAGLHAVNGFRQELNRVHQELENLEENLEACTNEIKQVNEEIEPHRVAVQRMEMQRIQIEDKEAELAKAVLALGEHKSTLEDDLTTKYTAPQLQKKIGAVEARMPQHAEKRQALERDLKAAKSAIKSIAQKYRNLREQVSKLQAQKLAHEELIQRRLKQMDAIAIEYPIEVPVIRAATQNSTGGTQETSLSVTAEDMHAFFMDVTEMESLFKSDCVRRQYEYFQRKDDTIQEKINKISVECYGIENDYKKLENELDDIRSEFSSIVSQASAQPSRYRQSDIDTLREKAANYAKQRDEASNNKDLKEIPAQIQAKDSQIGMLKREIEDDNAALRELRLNRDAQSSITVLKKQAASELESLKEALNDNLFVFTKFNLTAPALPDDKEEANGDLIAERVQNFSNAINDKNEMIQQELAKTKDGIVSQQRVVSEKLALLAHHKYHLASLRSKLDYLGDENGSVSKFQRAVAAVRQYEQNAGISHLLEWNDPQDVMAHLSSRLEEIEKASRTIIHPEKLTNLLNQLYKMSAVGGDNKKVQCPCCTRDFVGLDGVRKFKESLDGMNDEETSELLRANKQAIEKSRTMKAEYQNWRNVVSETMQGVMNWTRMTTEAKDAVVTIRDIEQDLTACSNELNALKETVSERLQGNADEIRNLYESSRRWTEDASRLSRKRMEIYQKKTDLSISTNTTTDRDLQTVEEDLSRRQTEKDSLDNQINQLNKKMTELNNTIAKLSQQAANVERLAKDKQKKFENEQQSTIRKEELKKRRAVLNEQLPKLKSKLLILRATKRVKERNRNRIRKLMNDHVLQPLSDAQLRKFESDMFTLHQIQVELDMYLDSSKEKDPDGINETIASLVQRREVKTKIEAELQKIRKKMEDQASQRDLIAENLKMIDMEDRVARLEKVVDEAVAEAEMTESVDNDESALAVCQVQLNTLLQTRVEHEGRRRELVDQMRYLKRKLFKSEEYKDIEERHRIAAIKYETTLMAVSDLEKYHAALDNALIRYHETKLEEINRIVRQLWALAYKGEGITNVELEFGREQNARKYRVVMSKGNAKLNMSGRCSTGQRALASIIIRMALAKTLCVNCGCIALDEPAAHLDYGNKQGLVVALAQIISSCSAQQSNFQLIVLTHDEEFVSMMKAELTSQPGAPEKFFHVHREEAADGTYYSEIDVIDWSELD